MLFTVGHSNISLDAFMKVMESGPGHIDVLMDVRSHPTSKWEQFRKEELQHSMPARGVGYVWEPRLGGWTADHMALFDVFKEYGVNISAYARGKFPKQRIAPKRADCEPGPLFGSKPEWTNQGLYDYSWFESLTEFLDGADELMRLATSRNVAIMCCESLWWKCHRSMISDYVVWAGGDALHLQPKLTSHKKSIGNRIERYDTRIIEAWREYRQPVRKVS